MSDHKSTLTAILVDGVSGPARQIRAEITGIGQQVSAVSSILQGVGQELGKLLFEGVTEAFSKLTELIPDLIQKGNDYLEQLKQIQLETGMTAEQTSALAGVAADYGVSTGELSTLLARLGNNIGNNEKELRGYGIATRNAKNELLGVWDMFNQVREAISAHGNSTTSARIAMQLFGKSGQDLLPILSLDAAAFKAAIRSVEEFGGIVSQSAIDGADKFKRGLDTLHQAVIDVGVNIASALNPYLEQFIANFTAFVQAHLNDIINFFVVVTNAVIGFVSGLFGITNAISGVAPATKAAGDAGNAWASTLDDLTKKHTAFTDTINSQIKAIDRQSQAITEQEQARHATRERERLAKSLSDARAQLADLQGSAPFLGGLSATEQVLAVQKHAQDIKDARQNVSDQEKALGDFELDQRDRREQELLRREKSRLQERLQAENKAFKDISAGGLKVSQGWSDQFGKAIQNTILDTQRFAESARGAFAAGADAAKVFLDLLLGAEGPEEKGHPGARTGGIVGALGAVGDALGGLGGILHWLEVIALGVALGGIVVLGIAIGSLLGPIGVVITVLGALAVALSQVGGPLGMTQNTSDFREWFKSKYGRNPTPLEGDAWRRGAYANEGAPRYTGGPLGAAEGGWVGLHGPELRKVGEEGPEYVIPNSRLGGGGGGGQPLVVQLVLDGRVIHEVVSRRMYYATQHAPVTSTPVGGF